MSTPHRANKYKGQTPRPKSSDPYDGLLIVDKPSGMTSHDVVDAIRRHFSFRKVGHGGTLDPMATGLLAILIGRGTKLSQQVMRTDKVYEGTMRFGISTDTQDAEGEIIGEADASHITRDQVEQAIRARVGDLMQTPPMVSAIKQNGVPLYKLARKGKTVEREPRLIHIYSFSVNSFELPDVNFRLKCTKGTYVRTLCSDIGDELDCGAHLSQLRRTQSGPLRVEDATPLDQVLATRRSDLGKFILSPHRFLSETSSSSS